MNIGLELAKEMKARIENGTLPCPAPKALRRLNNSLRRYGVLITAPQKEARGLARKPTGTFGK